MGVIPTDVVRFVTVAAPNFLLFLCLLYQQENKLSSYSFQTKILLPILLRYMFLVYIYIFFLFRLLLLAFLQLTVSPQNLQCRVYFSLSTFFYVPLCPLGFMKDRLKRKKHSAVFNNLFSQKMYKRIKTHMTTTNVS